MDNQTKHILDLQAALAELRAENYPERLAFANEQVSTLQAEIIRLRADLAIATSGKKDLEATRDHLLTVNRWLYEMVRQMEIEKHAVVECCTGSMTINGITVDPPDQPGVYTCATCGQVVGWDHLNAHP